MIKKYNNVIYILLFILTILLINIIIKSYKTYKYYHNCTDASQKTILNHERIMQVEYINPNKTNNISELSKADIIFEFLIEDENNKYLALFSNSIPSLVSSDNINIVNDSYFINYVKDISFSDNSYLKNINTEPAKAVFVAINNYFFSSFLYKNEQYYHYRDKTVDIDTSNNSEISVDNIIIQFCDDVDQLPPNEILGNGTGLFFSKGYAIPIYWSKSKDNSIKIVDFNKNYLSLNQGKTWWIILSKRCSIAYK